MFQYLNKNTSSDWIGIDDESLTGFDWRTGSKRVTNGIHMWPKIFQHDYPNGRKIAIILMDTQGIFDCESTIDECMRIFALSTLLTSVQIYNVSKNIQEDQLQHLQLFSDYGDLATENGNRPFQQLLFLVRDWQFPFEYDYGRKGGEDLLQERLGTNDKPTDLKSVRDHISRCFENIGCFLMPHPGMQIVTNSQFDGKIRDLNEDFRNNIEQLVPQLFAPENLVAKKINNKVMKASQFFAFLKKYVAIFQSDQLPTALSVGDATANIFNNFVLIRLKTSYKMQMLLRCIDTAPALAPGELETEHLKAKSEALLGLANSRIMHADLNFGKLEMDLKSYIEAKFVEFKRCNELKIA